MVPRYARPDMVAIWEPAARFRIWFEIEAYAAQAMGQVGMIPRGSADAIMAVLENDTLGEIDVERIDAIEAVTKHDVIAFLTWVSEKVGPDARFLHQGMTSSDVLDTALAVQLARASDILIADLDKLLTAHQDSQRLLLQSVDDLRQMVKAGQGAMPQGVMEAERQKSAPPSESGDAILWKARHDQLLKRYVALDEKCRKLAGQLHELGVDVD